MLKRICTRKLVITSLTLVLLLIIYLIPTPVSIDKKQEKRSVQYTTDAKLHEVFLLDDTSYVARTNVPMGDVKTIEDKCRYLLEVLTIDGKKDSLIPSGFTPIIPAGTEILGLTYDEGIVKVNFSSNLLTINKDLEEKMIEAITYTLTSIEEINGVIIFVDGEILTRLPQSKTTLPSVLNKDFGINKTYNIHSVSDINSVVIYYLNKHNDDYYYVPVTSYTNDKREKIKIIIDELAAGPTYESNLMSFVNSNVKLLNYEEKDDSMKLVFNTYILSDVDSKDILEEVIYSIALSIRENYDVKEVSIYVEDEEIVKSVIKDIE